MAHWYKPDGSTAYVVIGKNGKERDTTLADAKKNNWWPSVTTIIGCKASPGLDVYKQNQLLEAAWKWIFEQEDIESYSMYVHFKNDIIKQSKQHSQQAAKRGTEIHDLLEQWYKDEGSEIVKDLEFIVPVIHLLQEKFPHVDDWVAEASFCHIKYGFGGKIDLHSPKHKIVIDFKTKDTDDEKKMQCYSEHQMQSAAYVVGLSGDCLKKLPSYENSIRGLQEDWNITEAEKWERYNLFISTQVSGLLKLVEHENFNRDWGRFKALLDFWILENNHSSRNYNVG